MNPRLFIRLAMLATATAALLLTFAGCDDRARVWDQPVDRAQAFGLANAVAVTDPDAERVLLLTTDGERRLFTTPVPIQRGVRAVQPAPDGSKLFLASEGDGDARPPAGQAAQGAALEVIIPGTGDGANADPTSVHYPLSEPLTGLALDPRGDWAVLYADSTSKAFVRNPNELLLVDLTKPPAAGTNPLPHTLRSFGGKPLRLSFTDTLSLPGGPRRLLIVETEQDVAILDLSRPEAPEITIQLTTGADTRRLRPAGVIWSDGDAPTDDARIAVRMENDSTVLIARLVPDAAAAGGFRPELDLTDVGGIPSDAAFVRTDGGALALAALVPSRSAAVVFDPLTGLTQEVALPAAYRRLSLVTEAATGSGAAATTVDVALLWNGDVGGAAFWELGRTVGRPYRSVETVGVTAAVTNVVDVRGGHPELKLLGTSASTFFLLDLRARTAAPFMTSTGNVSVAVATGGDRAWAFVPQSRELAVVDLVGRHPQEMRVDRPISALFEIAAAAPGAPAGARSLVAWHKEGSGGVTVYDARATDDIDARRNHSAILLGGL